MSRTFRPSVAASVIASTALVVALTGCTSGDDTASGVPSASASASASASPTASPTPANPAAAAKEERIADALRRYEEYLEIDEKHQKAGTNGYEELALYLGHPDILNNEHMKWDYITEHGYKMVGDFKPIVSVVDAQYDGNPLADTISGHRVHLDLCTDPSGTHIVDADGKTVFPESTGRSITKVLMQGQPGERWTINEITSAKKNC